MRRRKLGLPIPKPPKQRARKSVSKRRPPRPQAARRRRRRRRRRRNMLLLFETPAGYSLFKVKDENKLKDIDVRGLPFFAWNPPPIGERAINDLIIVCSVALLSLSLSKSSRSIRNENATIVSSLFISHVSVDGMSRAKRRTSARASRRDLTFVQKLTPPIYFGLLFFSWTLFLYKIRIL